MASDLEEPGWPSLYTPGVPSPGETFLNAFQAVSNVNARKQALEQQIATLNANMAMHQQAHDLDMQQFAWKQKFDVANLNREATRDQNLAIYQDRMATASEDRVNTTLNLKDAATQNASDYSNALQNLAQKYPDNYDSQAFQNDLSLLNQQYRTTTDTVEGRRAWNTFSGQIARAQVASHRHSSDLLTNVQHTLKAGSRSPQPWTLPDLGLDPAYHIADTDPQGTETLGIAEVPELNPVTGKPGWKPLTKDQLSAPNANYPGMRWRTINKAAVESAMPLYEKISGIASGDPNKMPAPVKLSKTELAQQALDDPEATAQEKAAAKRILGVQ